MATEQKKNPLDALSLLVDAANAQSTATQKKGEAEAPVEAPKTGPAANGIDGAMAAASNAAAAAAAQQRNVEMEIREALHRQAMEREALEGEAMLQHRAALMSAGLGGLGGGGGLNFQEAEYMQQLRLEALVQQRRQETLAQLALAQEYNPEAQALIAAQLRQAAMMREQEILMAGGGMAAHMDPMAAALRQREGARNENALLRLFEERDRQHKLALGGPAPPQVSSMDTSAHAHTHTHTPSAAVAAVVAAPINPPTKPKEDSALALAGSKVTVLPCRARGMPMDHNAKTAYFVVPEDVKHGAELVCSYDHCRNAGIKFRYCVFCSLPVAKRNFFKKHKHDGKIPPERLTLGIPKDEEMAPDGKQDEPPKRPVVRSWNTIELAEKALSSSSGLGKPGTLKKTYSSGEMAQMVEMRKRKWEKLLDTRPLSQSETELVLWIRKVLDISDMTPPTPLGKGAPPKPLLAVPKVVAPPPPVVVAKKNEPEKVVEVKEPEKVEVKPTPATTTVAPTKPTEEEEDKASGADSSEGDDEEEEDGNASAKDDDEDDDDEMEEDAPAEDEGEKDGNISDASASSSGSSVDLRAHKRAKKE